MKDEKAPSRWFLIKHDCGAMFTINADHFLEVPEKQIERGDNAGYELRCPNCQNPIGQDLVKGFVKFISKHKELVDQFAKKGLNVREVSNQDLNSLWSP